MKNIKVIMLWMTVFGLLLIVCGCGKRKSATIPASLLSSSYVKLSLSETNYNFGGVVVNNSVDREFTITNSGNESGLQITGIISDKPTEFNITSQDCSTKSPLGRAANCTFNVRFTPDAQGPITGSISIDSVDLPTETLSLSGEGYGLNVWINKADFSTCTDATVDVTVTGESGPITSLGINDFQIWQNNNSPDIKSFEIDTSDPLSVALALDMSDCLTGVRTQMKNNANAFIGNLCEDDEAAIFKFQNNIIYYPDSLLIATNSAGIADLQDYIDENEGDLGSSTSLYNAVYDSITRAASGNNSKKVVIVFSDGANENLTGKTLEQVIEHAIDENVTIFTIFYANPDHPFRAKPEIMRQLAEETGGQDYYAELDTIDSIFSQVGNILSSNYVLHFASSNCSGSIPLKVKATKDGSYGIDSRTFTNP